MAKTMQQWFDAYGESHQHATNVLIHWICVPTIYFCALGLLYSVPLPDGPDWLVPGFVAYVAIFAVMVFYMRLSVPLGGGMVLFSLLCLRVVYWLEAHAPWPLWAICLTLFALAWIGQFYGHKVEGKKPSFLDDLQFLMIGPAWLMAKLFRRSGLSY
ncbi:MAG: DUF962 domain-containing protein [Flavobacteriales bacterium]|nr:DUF962 domain-containing protein [Flavobacteriales bacterium]